MSDHIQPYSRHALYLRHRFIALLAALVLLLPAATLHADTLTLYVERERMHTALLLPANTLLEKAPAMSALLNADSDTQWLRFGWGEAGYFGHDDRTSGATIAALFWPSPSVLEVASLESPRSNYSESYALQVSREEFSKIVNFIQNTFSELDDTLSPQRQANLWIRYYNAKPRYHLFYNCNNWTAQALQEAGIIRSYRRAWLARSVIKRLPQ